MDANQEGYEYYDGQNLKNMPHEMSSNGTGGNLNGGGRHQLYDYSNQHFAFQTLGYNGQLTEEQRLQSELFLQKRQKRKVGRPFKGNVDE